MTDHFRGHLKVQDFKRLMLLKTYLNGTIKSSNSSLVTPIDAPILAASIKKKLNEATEIRMSPQTRGVKSIIRFVEGGRGPGALVLKYIYENAKEPSK